MLFRSAPRRLWVGGIASTPSLGLDLRPTTGQYVNVVPEGNQPRRMVNYADNNNNFQASSLKPLTEFASPEKRLLIGQTQGNTRSSKWNKILNASIYDELLKLPLRYRLHPYTVLYEHMKGSSLPSQVEEEGGSSLQPGVYEMGSKDKGEDSTPHYYYSVAGKTSGVGYAPPLGPADDLDTIPFFVHRDSNGRLPGKVYSMDSKKLMPNFFMRISNVEGNLFRFEEELMKIFPTKKIFVRAHSVYVYNVALDGREVLHHWLYGLGF